MQPNKTFLSSWEQNKYDESVFETPKKKPKVSGIFEQGNTVPKSLKSSSKLKFPDRVMGNFQKDFESTYAMHVEFDRERNRKKTSNNEIDARRDSQDKTTATVLASEMFPDVPIPHLNPPHTPKRHHTTITDFTLPSPKYIKSPIANFSKSNFSSRARDFLTSPRKSPRQIAKNPFKVLDAPELADDFYLNLVDWGNSNVLSVGLGSCVYLWNSQNSKVTRLCDLSTSSDTVTSVTWNPKGDRLAVGTNKGLVQIYDVQATTKIQEYQDHTARVGALAWSNDLLTSGSRDRTITHRDPLKPNAAIRKLTSHKQEVCGLKWNPDFTQLASGGNDNKLFIWDKSSNGTNPILRLNDHTAAVKAIAWNPNQHGLLASGGGTADRHIRFWNTLNGTSISAHDTGSQVCNLAWSKSSNELVSTHGYSQNQICIWEYPSMNTLATLTGHTMRVLFLAMSPDGQNIVTGAGDETLRFWNVFSKGKKSEVDIVPKSLSFR